MENSRHDEFTRLLIQHEPELIRYIMVAVPNRTDARDIMQECSVSLWNKFATFDSNRSFVPWALASALASALRVSRPSSPSMALASAARDRSAVSRTWGRRGVCEHRARYHVRPGTQCAVRLSSLSVCSRLSFA